MAERIKVEDKEEILEHFKFPCSVAKLWDRLNKMFDGDIENVEISIVADDEEPFLRFTTFRDETDDEMIKRLADKAAIARHHELLAMVKQEEVERLMLAHLKEKYER